VITRDLLDRSLVRDLTSRLEDLLSRHGRRAFGDIEGQKEVRFTFAVHELDYHVASVVRNQTGALWKVARSLAGVQDLCVLMDRGFSKDPGDPETHWHRDDEAVSLPVQHPFLRTVHAWIPLGNMTSKMGTLKYLVGTHRRVYEWHERLLASLWGWEFTWWNTASLAQDDNLWLGDVAWHDGWILHSAGENTASGVRNGFAVSFAYCASADGCAGTANRRSSHDPTCRIASHLFSQDWRERHRRGEEDYVKTMLSEPLSYRAARFIWRSIVGALAGIGIHWLVTLHCCSKRAGA